MAPEDKNRSGQRPLWAHEHGAEPTGGSVGNTEPQDAGLRAPELPSMPALPDAPILRPNLPKLEKPSKEAEEYRQMGIAYTLPAMLVAPILLLMLIGYWLDNHFHKSPTFTLCGAVLGAVTGFINMIRAAGKLNK